MAEGPTGCGVERGNVVTDLTVAWQPEERVVYLRWRGTRPQADLVDALPQYAADEVHTP